MERFTTMNLNRVLAAVLTIAALLTGQNAWADQSWSVTNDGNVFTITRTETATAESVKYRTYRERSIEYGSGYQIVLENLFKNVSLTAFTDAVTVDDVGYGTSPNTYHSINIANYFAATAPRWTQTGEAAHEAWSIYI